MMKSSSELAKVTRSLRGRSAPGLEQLLASRSVTEVMAMTKPIVEPLRGRVPRTFDKRRLSETSLVEPELSIPAMPIGRRLAHSGSRSGDVLSGQPRTGRSVLEDRRTTVTSSAGCFLEVLGRQTHEQLGVRFQLDRCPQTSDLQPCPHHPLGE